MAKQICIKKEILVLKKNLKKKSPSCENSPKKTQTFF
jgi:hypothetical protein